ncbi:L,D-transpeptidase [Chthonobacter rhizosphaerae]|uniref:L,D-transpeptidase n=1 Tax=Chthonobacter rhizosphaerae TaxID=2735553 RepID=UPI0015EE52F8|nr:L,D-transpeptidase [Chthonobacter rhizosphaerae]
MRLPSLLACAVATVAAVFCGEAAAQSGRYATPPPIVLSPNLTEPWVTQLRPGDRPIYRKEPRSSARVRRLPTPEIEITPAAAQAAPKTLHPSQRPIAEQFLPTLVTYDGPHAPGTVVIDTNSRHLYLVEAGGMARRYGVGVGRPGFEWAGTHRVTRKAEWPAWVPPPEMRQRQPYLPARMEGGPKNPLGARALYLGSTLYRIHGTSEPWTIGSAVSSGCIRMRNEDVIDLYGRVPVGARVVVM